MKKKNLWVLLALPLMILSCGGPQNPLANLVPGDSQVFVQIENPRLLMTNLDQFIKPLGLEKLTQNKTSAELLDSVAKESNGMFDPAWFDFERPVGFALSGIGTGGGQPKVLVYLPVKDLTKNIANLDKLAKAAGEAKVTSYQGYAILAVNYTEAPVFPAAKPLDLTSLSTLEKGGISYFVDFNSLKSAFGFDPAKIIEEINSELEMGRTASLQGPSQVAMTKDLIKGLVDAVDQGKNLHGAVVADATGLKGMSGLEFVKDGSVAKWLKDIPSVKGTQDFQKYLAPDALVNVVLNLPAETQKRWTLDLTNWLFKFINLDAAKVAEQNKLMAPLMDLLGNRSAMSFDVDYDMAEIQKMSTGDAAAIKDALGKAFSLKIAAVTEVKDGQAYSQALKAYYSSNLWKDILSSLTKDAPLPIEFAFDYKADQKDGDFSYDTIEFKFNLTGDNQSPVMMETMGMVSGLLQKFKVYSHFSSNKVYLVIADKPLEALKALVAKDAVSPSLADSKTIKSLAAYAPDDANFWGNFSLRRVAQLVVKSGAPFVQMVPQLPEDSPGLIGYAKVSGNKLETGSAWAIKEIAEVAKLVAQVAPMLGSFLK